MIKTKWIMVTCKTCGKRFLKRACWAKRTENHFCSYSCNGKQRVKVLRPYCANGKGKKQPQKGLPGAKNPAWKGGVTYWRKHGNYKPIKYVRCPVGFLPMARKDGYIMEHRLIMAKMMGRVLTRREVVHHKNHDPQDNSPDNLELFESNQAHKKAEGQRAKCAPSAAG